jgi:DNA modification methylase
MHEPMTDVRVLHGDALAALRSLPDASIDAVVTDPPYGLADHRPAELVTALTAWVNGDRERVPSGKGFMGKDWDAFVPPPAVWDECLRVLKPGGHLVAFAGSRTYDLMGLSIRLAGFEIRDGLQWLYGSGFPKGQDVGKAIDATLLHGGANSRRIKATNASRPGEKRERWAIRQNGVMNDAPTVESPTNDNPATPDAARWQGWNTSLKPAHEPIVLARKPPSGTVARNVLEHGTGALNVDGCRVAMDADDPRRAWQARYGGRDYGEATNEVYDALPSRTSAGSPAGRWPANVLLSHSPECGPDEDPQPCPPGCPVAELDGQSGTLTSGVLAPHHNAKPSTNGSMAGPNMAGRIKGTFGGDSGGASRFFPTFRYQAKAPKAERPRVDGVAHPTVKPLALMAWLVRLITPPGGLVLDPFAGSGTTLQAARDEGMASVGVEREPSYLPLIAARLGVDPATFEHLAPAAVPEPEPAPLPLPVPTPLPVPEHPLAAEVRAADTVDALVALWRANKAEWTDELSELGKVQRAKLECAA